MKKKNFFESLVSWLYLTPHLCGFLVFVLFPVVFVISLTLFKWNIFHSPRFTGVDNFVELLGWTWQDNGLEFNDPLFWKYLGNTLFLMLGIPVNMLGSLAIASFLNNRLRGSNFFKTMFYLPTICSGVGLFLLWSFIFNAEFGAINMFLARLGISGPGWLSDYQWAKPALLLMGAWGAMGGNNMLLYLVGLQRIPQEVYEAAKVDGTSAVQRFWMITVPLLAPTSFFIFVISVAANFQGWFDAAYVMTQGGPAGSTTTLSYYIYKHAFEWFNMGYAATISVVLFGIVMIFTILGWKYGGKNEYV